MVNRSPISAPFFDQVSSTSAIAFQSQYFTALIFDSQLGNDDCYETSYFPYISLAVCVSRLRKQRRFGQCNGQGNARWPTATKRVSRFLCRLLAGTTSYGRTSTTGEYEMMFSDTEAGAWLGENAVRITTEDVGTGDSPASKERVPSVYNARTTLKAMVEKKANVFDFELKSSAGKVKQAIVE